MIIRTKPQDLAGKNYDAIVIGSGMGGMACATALAKVGKKVLMLEQHYVVGGMTHTFKRKGFVWDVGVHALGEMEEKRMPGHILKWLSDGEIKMAKYGDGEHQDYDTFNFPDESFSLPSESRVLSERLKTRFPNEASQIEKYFDLIVEVGKTGRLYFFIKTWPKWLASILSPFLLRKFNKWSQTTVKAVHDKMFKDEKLKAILAGQWGYHGLPPSQASFYIHALVFKHFWNGAFYPEGSSKVIADSLVEKITKVGGDVLVRTPVKKLLVENEVVKGVEIESGEQFFSDIVVGAGSARNNVKQFIRPNIKNKNFGEDILSLKPTPCHICLYIGFEGDITETEATQSNQWLYSSWDHEKMIWDASDPNTKADCLYVSFPTMKDPKPHSDDANKHTAEVVTFVPWENFEKWKQTKIRNRGEDYEAFKQSIQDRIVEQMNKNYPKLMEKVTYMELSTPLSTVFYCDVPKGAIYGLEATPKRFKIDELRPSTPIKGFYMSGSDVASCGVVGALMGGFLTAAAIDKKVTKILR